MSRKVHHAGGFRAARRKHVRQEKIQANEDRKAIATRRVIRLGGADTAYNQAASLGMTLVLSDGGKHWIFRDPSGQGPGAFVEWWPKVGRLVFDRRYGSAQFSRDLAEVIRLIARYRLVT